MLPGTCPSPSFVPDKVCKDNEISMNIHVKQSDFFAGFEDHIKKGPGCWLWTGSANGPRKQYGTFNGQRAHRIAYSLWMADIPDGMFVCHHCDTPLCVRPDHLFLGTAQDNSDDMVRKGRQYSKLRPHDVTAIKILVRHFTQVMVALKYRISRSHISNIVAGRRWGHLIK